APRGAGRERRPARSERNRGRGSCCLVGSRVARLCARILRDETRRGAAAKPCNGMPALAKVEASRSLLVAPSSSVFSHFISSIQAPLSCVRLDVGIDLHTA